MCLEGIADLLDCLMSNKRDLKFYERLAVENHVRDIIFEFCKVPEARRRFCFSDGV